MLPRKGARSTISVDKEILSQLNAGLIETASLSEGLVVDFNLLAKNVGIKAKPLQEKGVVKRMEEMASYISSWEKYLYHTSDTVRGWAAYSLKHDPKMTFEEKVNAIKPLAADAHFGVREWAWLALRPPLILNLDLAFEVLLPWTTHEDPNLRRFASEITRPCGVWCAHIPTLKQNPELGRLLLENLKSDPSRYVQNSVGNWLNDAAKSNPDWVRNIAKRWSKESQSKETVYILKRGLRSLPC